MLLYFEIRTFRECINWKSFKKLLNSQNPIEQSEKLYFIPSMSSGQFDSDMAIKSNCITKSCAIATVGHD